MTPAVLGLAAAAGYDALAAVPRPRVEVLVLGDELLTDGPAPRRPDPGRARPDARRPGCARWAPRSPPSAGSATTPRRCARRSPRSDADLIVTTGGTASGPVDHVHPILRRIGAELLVDGVDGTPRPPHAAGPHPKADQHLVGLPGNPLAAVSGLLTLAEPLLRTLAGRARPGAVHRCRCRTRCTGTRTTPGSSPWSSAATVPCRCTTTARPCCGASRRPTRCRRAARRGAARPEAGDPRLPWASASPGSEGVFHVKLPGHDAIARQRRRTSRHPPGATAAASGRAPAAPGGQAAADGAAGAGRDRRSSSTSTATATTTTPTARSTSSTPSTTRPSRSPPPATATSSRTATAPGSPTSSLITPLRVLFLIILVGTTLEVLTERTREEWRLNRWRSNLRDHTVVVGFGTKGRSAIQTVCATGLKKEQVVVVDPSAQGDRRGHRGGLRGRHRATRRAATCCCGPRCSGPGRSSSRPSATTPPCWSR